MQSHRLSLQVTLIIALITACSLVAPLGVKDALNNYLQLLKLNPNYSFTLKKNGDVSIDSDMRL